ncbi:hypothetical protein ACE38W_14895 [Chitinophaga sp. Hz27]|uniref:hypothetical protein n=1 Tax=Chitinophaga sp. Hz27 TaxID=3347169 RepID=UPI0035D55536
MKKLILGTAMLLAFNVAIMLTQMSCSKESKAQTTNPSGYIPQNKFLILENLKGSSTKQQLLIVDYAGQPQSSISPLILPNGVTFDQGRVTPDGKTIIFTGVVTGANGASKVYSMNIDGTNMKELLSRDPNNSELELMNTY